MRVRAIPILVVAGLMATPLVAVEGKIPIYEPTTITENGHYVVTRDIESDIGPILEIVAPDVVVDLGGHVLTLTDSAANVVHFMNGHDKTARLQNGTLRGGLCAVGREADSGPPPGSIDIEIVQMSLEGSTDAGLCIPNVRWIRLWQVAAVDSVDGIRITGPPEDKSGGASFFDVFVTVTRRAVILDGIRSMVERVSARSCGTGVTLTNAAGSEVVGSDFIFPGTDRCFQPQPEPPGIWIVNSPGTQLRGNIINGPGGSLRENHGISIDATSHDTLVLGNTIRNCGDNGVHVLSNGNSVKQNLVNANAGNGIFIGGSDNLVDGNRVGLNTGDGIFFDNAVGPHVYRFNVLRGNTGGAIGGDETNTDAGGNVL